MYKAEKQLRKLVKITKKRLKKQRNDDSSNAVSRYAQDYADSSYMLAKHLLRVKAPQTQIIRALQVQAVLSILTDTMGAVT